MSLVSLLSVMKTKPLFSFLVFFHCNFSVEAILWLTQPKELTGEICSILFSDLHFSSCFLSLLLFYEEKKKSKDTMVCKHHRKSPGGLLEDVIFFII